MHKIILQALPVVIFSYTAQVFLKRGAASLRWEIERKLSLIPSMHLA